MYIYFLNKMLAADIFEVFREVGFSNDEAIKSLFKRLTVLLILIFTHYFPIFLNRYRETFLFYGSSLPINETFRRFRGRNPSTEPFIDSFKKQIY
jgi:Zn-dependent oligopeptidase